MTFVGSTDIATHMTRTTKGKESHTRTNSKMQAVSVLWEDHKVVNLTQCLHTDLVLAAIVASILLPQRNVTRPIPERYLIVVNMFNSSQK